MCLPNEVKFLILFQEFFYDKVISNVDFYNFIALKKFKFIYV